MWQEIGITEKPAPSARFLARVTTISELQLFATHVMHPTKPIETSSPTLGQIAYVSAARSHASIISENLPNLGVVIPHL